MTLVRFAFVCGCCDEPAEGTLDRCVQCEGDICGKCVRIDLASRVICKRCDDKQFADQDYKRDAAEDRERAYPDREWRMK